ncbi:MAG: hypothetical protein EPN93_13875 [Spirochaetes bacterium]|nr:MAG: hypothetical protein EPN93_13875 [Spirochaetota bacterium]
MLEGLAGRFNLSALKKPILYILALDLAIYLVGVTWGLPNVEDWLTDSLAPYHPLIGLSKAFSFGYFNKYPVVHQLILAVLNLPVVIGAFIAHISPDGFRLYEFLSYARSAEFATWLILIDRLVSVTMGLLTVYFLYLGARELFSERAALIGALLASFNISLNYYAHVAKVEVPYVFWAVVSLYFLIRIVKYDGLRDYVWCVVAASLSHGSKDQGYAIFVLPFVLFMVVYQVVARSDKALSIRDVLLRKKLWIGAGALVVSSLLAQSVLFNPDGFVARFEHLTKEGGVRNIQYSYAIDGIYALWRDSIKFMMLDAMTVPLFVLSVAGMGLVAYRYRKDGRELFLKLFYLFPALSYSIFFVQVIRQSSVRYSLPTSLFITVFAGFAADYLLEKTAGLGKKAVSVMLVLVGAFALYEGLSVNATMLGDVRYDAEAWMNTHMTKGAVIEYYSYLQYLPRFPGGSRSYRVKNDVGDIEKRRPDYLVLTSKYYQRFLRKPELDTGRMTTIRMERDSKSGMPEFLDDLFADRLNYRLEKRFDLDVPFFRVPAAQKISPDHILVYRRLGAEKK